MVHSSLLDHGGLLEILLLNLFIYALIFGYAWVLTASCAFLAVAKRGYSLAVVHQLLLVVVASLLAEDGLYLQASVVAVLRAQLPWWPSGYDQLVVMAHGLSHPMARGIIPRPGMEPVLLH